MASTATCFLVLEPSEEKGFLSNNSTPFGKYDLQMHFLTRNIITNNARIGVCEKESVLYIKSINPAEILFVKLLQDQLLWLRSGKRDNPTAGTGTNLPQ